MKVAVFSDSHANIAPMVDAVRGCAPDVILHLGDHDRDAQRLHALFPDIPLHAVSGNCDRGADTPETALVQLGPVKAFLTHGHLYGVRYSLDRLVYAAQEAQAQLALFGHTHEGMLAERGGVKLINPGTAGQGRRRSWALLEIGAGGDIRCELRAFLP